MLQSEDCGCTRRHKKCKDDPKATTGRCGNSTDEDCSWEAAHRPASSKRHKRPEKRDPTAPLGGAFGFGAPPARGAGGSSPVASPKSHSVRRDRGDASSGTTHTRSRGRGFSILRFPPPKLRLSVTPVPAPQSPSHGISGSESSRPLLGDLEPAMSSHQTERRDDSIAITGETAS